MIRDSFKYVSEILSPTGRGALQFATLFSAAAPFYCQSRLASRYPNPEMFVQRAILSIPELSPITDLLLLKAREMTNVDLSVASDLYIRTRDEISLLRKVPGTTACETIIVLAFLLGETIFDDDINITTLGMRALYDRMRNDD